MVYVEVITLYPGNNEEEVEAQFSLDSVSAALESVSRDEGSMDTDTLLNVVHSGHAIVTPPL